MVERMKTPPGAAPAAATATTVVVLVVVVGRGEHLPPLDARAKARLAQQRRQRRAAGGREQRGDASAFTAGTELKAVQLFRRFDEDGGGSVSVVELDGGLRAMNIELNEATLTKLVHHYDDDRSGELDLNEWVALVRDAFKATQKSRAGSEKPQSEVMRAVLSETAAECIAALQSEEEAERDPESAGRRGGGRGGRGGGGGSSSGSNSGSNSGRGRRRGGRGASIGGDR